MRFIILGAGAVGGYVGGSLAAAGHGVTFVARPHVAEHWRANGLRLEVAGQVSARTVRAFSAVSDLPTALGAGQQDCLVLAVKSYATAEAIEQIRAAAPAPPPIVCLQNGVDNEADLARAFGPERVIAGTVTTPVSKPDEGTILVERVRGLGVALTHPLAATLVEAFNGAGLRTRAYPAPGPMKWSKLFTNLVGNATAAILDLPVGAIMADPRLFALEMASLRECLAVMRARGFQIVDLPGMPTRLLAGVVQHAPTAIARPLLAARLGAGRGAKMPSLHVDLRGGRRQTEVRWLHGAVARHGAQVGTPAPVNRGLAAIVDDLASGRVPLDTFSHDPDRLVEAVNKG